MLAREVVRFTHCGCPLSVNGFISAEDLDRYKEQILSVLEPYVAELAATGSAVQFDFVPNMGRVIVEILGPRHPQHFEIMSKILPEWFPGYELRFYL